jgi:hypothetical protein
MLNPDLVASGEAPTILKARKRAMRVGGRFKPGGKK